MNKFILIPCFLLLLFNAKTQDKIISINNDTIRCSIVSISNERILYELKNNDGSVIGKFIPLSQVAEYSRLHQSEKNSNTNKQETPKTKHIIENPWYLDLNMGSSTMPWYLDNLPSSSSMPDYYNKLKTGFHINANVHYMLKEFIGLGVEYSFFKTSTSGSIPLEYSSSIFLMESEKYRQYINYLGASVIFKQKLDAQRKFILSESFSAGAAFIRMENQITFPNAGQSSYIDITNNSLLTGKSYSGKFGLTAEYKVLEDVSVGLGWSFIWCSIKKASFKSKGSNNYSDSVDNQKLPNAMKISRIDYSFVLRYNF